MRRKVIHVFLKNKLISLDSIIPFCMQLNAKCSVRFNFITFDKVSYETIINENIVLRDAILKIGSITNLGSSGHKYKYLRKLYSILFICRIWMRAIFTNDLLLHFGVLDERPFRLIVKCVQKRKVILAESNDKGRYEHELNSAMLRSNSVDYYQFRTSSTNIKLTEHQINKYFRAGILLGFDDRWNYFQHPNASRSRKIVYKKSKKSSAWIDFITNNSNKYIETEIGEKATNHKIVVFILGHIGHQGNEEKELHFMKNFIETLVVITKIMPENKIFIKPHAYTNFELINKYISNANKISNNPINYVITRLHPMILSSKAIFAIFNNNSTIIKEYFDINVPIIQYIRAIPDHLVDPYLSTYPDFIVRRSQLDLHRAINKIINSRYYDNGINLEKIDYKFNCNNMSIDTNNT